MKKPRHQPALASLTLAEREQLADWLRHEHYKAVLNRVNKPRPEGFGLRISEKPLRTFWMKVGLLDAINSKLSPDKKIPLAVFEKLASRDIHLLTSAENKTVAEAHAQILRTTADLAASGDNSPHQLLALQRLADFPARAQIRENHEQLNREKWAHKLDMDNFRKHIATERLELAKKSFALREKIATARWTEGAAEARWTEAAAEETSNPSEAKWSEAEQAHPGSSISKLPFRYIPGPCPLPEEIVIQNRAFAVKLLAGQIDLDTGEELPDPAPSPVSPLPSVQNPQTHLPLITNPFSSLPPEVLANNALYEEKLSMGEIKEISAPGELARVDYSNPADRDFFSTREESGTARFVPDPTRTDWLPGLRSFGPRTAPSPQNPNTSNQPTPSALVQIPIPTQHSEPTTQHLTSLSVSSVPLWLNQPCSSLENCTPDLAALVHHYTIARLREHSRWNNDRFTKPFPYASPPFVTQNRHCPCGHNAPTPEGGVATTPCPFHESAPFNPFPDSFWSLSTFSNAYIDHLTTRGLPYREPTDYQP